TDRHAFTYFHEALENHFLAGLQSFADHPVRSYSLPDFYRTEAGLVVGRDHYNLVQRLNFDDGRLRNQQRIFVHSGLDSNPSVASRSKCGSFIWKLRSQLDRGGLSPDLAIHIDELAPHRVGLSVCLDEFDRRKVGTLQVAVATNDPIDPGSHV